MCCGWWRRRCCKGSICADDPGAATPTARALGSGSRGRHPRWPASVRRALRRSSAQNSVRGPPRDQTALMEAGSAVPAAAVTKASAMTKASMGEGAMAKPAMVKAAVETEDANEPRVVETIRIVIGIPIRVNGRCILRGLRLHGIATRRHALQVTCLVEWLVLDRNGSVGGGRAGGNRRVPGRRIQCCPVRRAARSAGGRTLRGGPDRAIVTGVRHRVLLAYEAILLERGQILAGPWPYRDLWTWRQR
jgi:hypothetical protein